MFKRIFSILLILALLTGCSTGTGGSPPNNTRSFNSYELLIHFFYKEVASPSAVPYKAEKFYQEQYNALIANYAENGVFIPYLGNTRLPLSDSRYSPITVFQYELYNKPWIWYRTEINGNFAEICVMRLDDELAALAAETTCFNFGKQFVQKKPTKKNVFDYMVGSKTKHRGESTAELYDRTVSILYGQDCSGEWHIVFTYDDHLIRIESKEQIPAQWLKQLHFQRDRK